MHGWVCEWIDEWMNIWMSELTYAQTNEQMRKWINQCMEEWQ